MSSAACEPYLVGPAKRGFPWAWECWAAAACMFAYGLADPRIYRPLPITAADYILAINKFHNAFFEPVVVVAPPQMLSTSQHFLFVQAACVAAGIGLGISGIRRSRVGGKVFAAIVLAYLGWVVFCWYDRLA